MLDKLKERGIILVRVPAGTTNRLQLLDVSTNKAAKREKFWHWYAEQVEKQLQDWRGQDQCQHGNAHYERS